MILYRNAEYRKYQYSVNTEWPGGVYATPTLAGSRSGAVIAACWTAMVKNGRDGYVDATRMIIGCARGIAKGIENEIPELQVLGRPVLSVVAFTSKDLNVLNIYKVADAMSTRGWHLNGLQFPPALHIACTMPTVGHRDDFIHDLKESVQEALQQGPDAEGGMAAMYGAAAKIPDRSLLGDVAKSFVDCLYKVN